MTDETPAAEGPSGPQPELDVPRLGIRHLMLWTACCALYLGLYRVLFLVQDGSSDEVQDAVFAILFSLSAGASFAACALCVPWNWAGIRFPYEPGEWMLAVAGVSLVVGIAFWAGVHYFLEWFGWREFRYWIIGGMLATCWLHLVPLCLARVTRRWRIVFALLLVRDVAVVLAHAASMLTFPDWSIEVEVGGFALAVVVIGVAAFADLRAEKRYRWTHWAGVFFSLWTHLVAAVQLAAIYLSQPWR